MLNLTSRERATAITSALLAIAILGTMVTAQPSRPAVRDRLASLESDLRFQLDLAWRDDRPVLAARMTELGRTLEAWRASPQTEHDRELMTAWLREAIVRSLPGESGELPPAPEFGAVRKKEIVAVMSSRKPRMDAKSTALKSGAASAPAQHSGTHRAVALPAEALGAPERRVLGSSKVEKVEKAANVERTPEAEKPKARQAAGAQLAAAPGASGRSAEAGTTAEVVSPAPSADAVSKTPTAEAVAPGPKVKAAPAIAVNLAELNARIGGYHQGLDEVEGRIVAARGKVTRLQAARLVTQVEELAAQCQFVRLYYEALTPQERKAVKAPRAMTSTIALVEQQLSRLEKPRDEDFLDSSDAPAEDELARRLKAVAEAVGEESAAER